ncbi:methyltransferase domain-containing protein [bacterium]|nr:methyltransferase domain-containing protein [bacterium]NDD85027.1 methyltransferase domain-containing protein [bacterium]
MKINLGSGLKKIDGFLNVDHDPSTNPDFLVDLELENLPFEDNSVDTIIAHHILEHIGDNFFSLMKEIYRVCKDGAIIDIEVPHHRHENFFGDPTHKRFITLEILKKFSKKYNDWHLDHYKSIGGFCNTLNVDFEIIEFDYEVDSKYINLVEQGKYEEINQIADRFNNVYCNFKAKLAVIK